MLRRSVLLTSVVGALLILSWAQAQEQGRRARGNRGAGGAGGAAQAGGAADQGGRRFDPAQMREQMMTRLKEQLGASEDEWKALTPKLEKAIDLQRDLNPRMGMFSSRTRGGDAQPQPPQSKLAAAQHDLRTAVEDKAAPAEDLSKKLTAYREARDKAKAELKATQKEIKTSVNARQEAVLVVNGLLD